MPIGKVKITQQLMGMSRTPDSVVTDVTEVFAARGVRIYPSVSREIAKMCARALSKGTIQTEAEFTLGSAALMAAGVEQARQSGRAHIRMADIDRGWENKLQHCPGNLPPHLCMGRSIIAMEKDLRDQMQDLDVVLKQIEQG